ncbi:MAG: HAMP domain-containing histidine kinase [Actinobacteria bacterium]|nr:HAMP domain-containing histidine kinase [Actinomycetota bacterium]
MIKTSIKTRIILLSNLVFLLTACIIVVFLYFAFAIALSNQEKKILTEEANHAAGHIREFLSKNESPEDLQDLITTSTSLSIIYSDGTIFNTGMDPRIIDLDFTSEQIRKVKLSDESFIVYDKVIVSESEISAKVRLSRSLLHINSTLTNVKIAIFTSGPLFFGILIIISLLLVNKILLPVDILTKTATTFSEKDLSRRIDIPATDDEIGRLIKTFNNMLSKIENSFIRIRQFTSDASHELRTPLTVIRADVEEALKSRGEIKSYRKTLKEIMKESQKMDHLISQLLFLTRSEENIRNLNIEDIDLSIVIKSVMNTVKNSARQKNIRFFLEGEENLKIKADQLLVTSLIMNLLNNSIKYNKNNGFVKIKTSRSPEYAEISIEDSGIGIPEKDLPLIFNRFYKTSITGSTDGSGIGLSIVKWIVEAHKGTIEVESRLGEGAKFSIKLPVAIN